jgi:hypothetical protein
LNVSFTALNRVSSASQLGLSQHFGIFIIFCDNDHNQGIPDFVLRNPRYLVADAKVRIDRNKIL